MQEKPDENVFLKIIRREIPAQIVFESETLMAFKDVNPQAPSHILVIPKKQIQALSSASAEDCELLGEMMLAVVDIARSLGLKDFRVVINNGVGAGQTVPHLHLHLLGGRSFSWPPG